MDISSLVCHCHFREDNEEYRLKLSDVYFTLGEVALESGMLLNHYDAMHNLFAVCSRPGRPGCRRHELGATAEGAVARTK